MKDNKIIQGHLNFSFIAKKMSFLAQGFARVDQWLSFLATAESMIFKPIDFLHKSKIVEGFLEETKPSTAAYTGVREERRRVSTTKSPTRLIYAGSLMSSLLSQASIILNGLSGYFSWIPAVARMTSFLSWRNSIRYLSKLAYAEEFKGATERRTATYLNVREDSSTGATNKLPAEVEFRKISIICLFILLLSNISLANEALPTKKIAWSFDGVFATVDRKAAQRGFQVYKEVCSSCHGLYNLYYRNLKDLGFSDEEIKEIAKNYTVQDSPNDAGEMFERPALPSDPFVRPYPNEQAARAANNGADPPDLSLIIKARPDGANYLYSILTGYSDPPENFKLMPGLNYNPYFPHSQIAMPPPLSDGQVKYIDGTNSSVEQMAMDVTTFLQWAAEPEMENRKSMGLKVMMFLVIFIIFFYISKNRIWKNLETEEYK